MRCGGTRLKGAPWYRSHPCMAFAVATLLFVGATVVQTIDVRQSDALALLSVLPIALLAVTFGMVGGLSAATVGYAIFAVFTVVDSTGRLGVDGWLTRAAVMFLLGGLLGRASDQTERAALLAMHSQRARLIAEEQNRRYSEGLEISDSILQHLAAAKWMLERGETDQVAGLLSTAMEQGQRVVGELLPPLVGSRERTAGAPPVTPMDRRAHPARARVELPDGLAGPTPAQRRLRGSTAD